MMTWAWLTESFHKYSTPKKLPSRIRMGERAYAEFLKLVQMAEQGPRGFLTHIKFCGAEVIGDSSLERDNVEFCFSERTPEVDLTPKQIQDAPALLLPAKDPF